MKRIFAFFILLASSFSLVSCENTPKIFKNINISKNEDLGHVNIHIKPNELLNNGYNLGDSLTFTFSNGYELKDIPFYNGYYGIKGDYMFVAYPTYVYPVLLKQYEENVMDAGHLTREDTVTISLCKKDGFRDYQDYLSLKYSNDRNNFESDEVFANYRCVSVGDIKEGRLYRSASPCNNDANRATYVNELMKKDKIDYVFDLSNSLTQQIEYAAKDVNVDYWKSLYTNNKVFDCKLSPNFYSDTYFPKIKTLCDGIIDNEGKYLFHCFEGKDRTGFVGILLEALCGASFEEIEKDYFITYKNYYNFTNENNPEAYEIYRYVRFFSMTNFLIGKEVDDKAEDDELYNSAVNYLIKCGLTSERIELLINRLTK